ncbi:hypothetical protein [Pseudooceanicola nanhaiensis]|jgi:hypothetical protein|uniref:hypothetical protein n=1 Tax=Pseudooceanicola nanhaiensis TaxID=375761 RepID=UPI00300BFA02
MALFDYVRQLAAISLVGLASLAAPQASASSYPNFVLDLNQSKIAVDSTTACSPNCALNGSFTSSGEKSVAFGSEGQTVSLNNLIKWTMQPGALAAGIYNISVELVFTSPELAETSGGGKGVFWTFFGILSGGVIDWTNPFQDVAFAQGSELGVKMDKVNFGFSNSSYSNLYLTAEKLVPLAAPSPAPIPPALPVMLLALGGLFYIGRRQRNATGGALPAM